MANKRVKIVSNFGVGFNNIDIDSAKKNNLVVTNTPEVLTDCTADIAMLLMLGVARLGSEGEFHVRKKEWTGWRPTHMMGTKVTGKTLGLIGMGRIAQAMAHKSHFGFNMKIIFFDPYFDNAEVIKKFAKNPLSNLPILLFKFKDFAGIIVNASRAVFLDSPLLIAFLIFFRNSFLFFTHLFFKQGGYAWSSYTENILPILNVLVGNLYLPVASFLPLSYKKSPTFDPTLYPAIAPPVPKTALPTPPPATVPKVAPIAPPRYPPAPLAIPPSI